ncbi:MAG: IS1595 family transposase [Gemmatimonadota bacterium]|nr:IS1595 family transposase [Gemmatimonadota bacterium]
MNLYEVFTRFPTQEACIAHLESIRFKNGAYCPLCGSTENVKRKKQNDVVGRWNCHDCKSSFNVLSGTVMQGTHIPLPKWFAVIAIMVNAKKSVSSPQLARDLSLNQKTAWYMQQRIRAAMTSDQAPMLAGIIEADETYVGGKPRKSNKKDDKPSKRGRGTDKTPVIGAVERDGNVVAQVAEDLTGKGILNFIRHAVKTEDSVLITDEYRAYAAVRSLMPHATINHQERYADGPIHTNTIEGFWALLKRAWYGSHHHYRVKFTPLYVSEAAWKYNNRGNAHAWDTFMNGVFA